VHAPDIASLRPVATTGDSPITARPGRSRATLSAVEPVCRVADECRRA